MAIGALRINSELRTGSQLGAAADQVNVVGTAVAFGGAAEDFAAAAAANAMTDATSARFRDSITAMEQASKTNDLQPGVAAGIATAVTTASALQENVASGGPAATAQLADRTQTVTAKVADIVSSAVDVDEASVRQQRDHLVAALTSRSALATERVLIAGRDADENPTTRAKILAATGSEVSALDAMNRIAGSTSQDAIALRQAAQQRIDTFAQPGGDPAQSPAVTGSIRSSVETYNKLTGDLTSGLEDTLQSKAREACAAALRDAALILGAVLIALVLALTVARSLISPIRRVREAALHVAQRQLPAEVDRVRRGAPIPQIEPVGVHSNEEIGQLARAVDNIHEQAVALAGEQAQLRLQVSRMFETLSRRSQSLIEKQLGLIESLERDENDPKRLDSLYRLDHLATRMRRNGDNLLVLAGTRQRRVDDADLSFTEILHSAQSEVEEYTRVEIGQAPDALVSSAAAGDIVHVVAELMDNALRYSPPDTTVNVSVHRTAESGYLIEIVDHGLGMSEADLTAANQALAAGGEVTPDTARRMGLFVVGRLAGRHNVRVSLHRTSAATRRGGVTAGVHLPPDLIVTSPEAQPIRDRELPSPPPPRLHRPPIGVVTEADRPVHRAPAPASPPVLAPPPSLAKIAPPPLPAPDDDSPSALPVRRPGKSDLPVRRPGNSDLPVRRPMQQTPARSAPRRPTVLAPVPPAPGSTPIFANMVSEWFAEPTDTKPAQNWSSPSDSGWEAAEKAAQTETLERTEGGLPVRRPGNRLVPGSIAASASSGSRDPVALRNNLNAHFSGVFKARAAAENDPLDSNDHKDSNGEGDNR